jgi:hypothetical protein
MAVLCLREEGHLGGFEEGHADEPALVDGPRGALAQQRRERFDDLVACAHAHYLARLVEVLAQLHGMRSLDAVELDKAVQLVHLLLEGRLIGVEVRDEVNDHTSDVRPCRARDQRDHNDGAHLNRRERALVAKGEM